MDISKSIDVAKVESLDELKSMAYDFTVQRDLFQTNINLVKAEIERRAKVAPIEEAEVTEK